MSPGAIARACVNSDGRPVRVATLTRALTLCADETPAVLHVVASRLDDLADSRLPLTGSTVARVVEQARAFVAEGGRVSLAGQVTP